MTKRKVTRAIRDYVLARDNWTCQYCGHWMSRQEATVDHVQPASLGGIGYGVNLKAACLQCNQWKANSSDAYLKMMLAFVETPWASIISLEQFHQLRGAGAALPELELRPFYFEEAAEHSPEPSEQVPSSTACTPTFSPALDTPEPTSSLPPG